MDSRFDIITSYFRLGLSQNDILFSLAVNHGIVISVRTLKRILHRAKLYRRKKHSTVRDIVSFIQEEIGRSGGLFGYRWMHTKCLQSGLSVSRNEVAIIMQTLDPDGVALRRQRKLRRRKYYAKGPNFVWHIDGWDKLKPYGIAVHGCVDGFSRHIVWLEAHTTNNNPKLVGGYFVKAVTTLGGVLPSFGRTMAQKTGTCVQYSSSCAEMMLMSFQDRRVFYTGAVLRTSGLNFCGEC